MRRVTETSPEIARPSESAPSSTNTRLLAIVGVTVWGVAIVAGFLRVLGYERASGRDGEPPREWPAASRLIRDPMRANLVMLAHPWCPCTRASIDELAHIMTSCPGAATAHVLFCRPSESAKDWAHTDLWRTAAAIPGVRVASDPGSVEAARFGTETSGHVLLFDEFGRLRFSGGITGSRGHFGDNAGRRAVIAALGADTPGRRCTPVFGCPLTGPVVATRK